MKVQNSQMFDRLAPPFSAPLACIASPPRSSQPAQRPLHFVHQQTQHAAISARDQSRLLVCHAAAAIEYGQLADLGVPSDTYLVLVSYKL